MSSLVFLDTETTGLSAYYDRLIEIHLLAVERNGDCQEWGTFINPERRIPARITEITGITDEDVKNAPREDEVAVKIRDFIGNRIVVAHNLAFDLSFLNAMFERQNLRQLSKAQGVDTLAISRKLFPKLCIYPGGEGSHKLKNLMYHFGLDRIYQNSHRARDDVLLLAQVYRHLAAYQNRRDRFEYPKEVTHGCPSCGSVMKLEVIKGVRMLVCTKYPSCQHRSVV
ncbi:MAG: hypothetical protein GX020_06030 [Firmicutes bacterium]|nr:hypothetical protein [Bacillota bacterium]